MYTTYNILDDVFKLRNVCDDFFAHTHGRGSGIYDFPYTNIYEEKDRLEIKALLPGVGKDDVHIELDNDKIIIESERKSDITDDLYIRRERSFGTSRKAIKLPFQVDREKINAKFTDGVLTLTLEKSDEAKPKKINIK